MLYLNLAIFIILAVSTIFFLNLAYRFIVYSSKEFEKNSSRFRNFGDLIRGNLIVLNDHLPDGRIQAGINYNIKKNRVEVTGKFSDEKIEEILR